MQNFSKSFGIGINGYYYDQVTGDSGVEPASAPPKAGWRPSACRQLEPRNQQNTRQHELQILSRVRCSKSPRRRQRIFHADHAFVYQRTLMAE